MLERLFDLNLVDARLFNIRDVLAIIFIALVIGLFIFLVYAKTFKGVMFSSSFGIALVMMSMITALIIYSVTINFLLSLGMVGALSIVRFRTVIKEPLDLAYLFWAIAAGILVGAGFFTMAIVGSASIGIILYVFVRSSPKDIPYIVIISCANEEAELASLALLKSKTKKHVIKAKTVTKDGIELTYEVRIKESSAEFMNELLEVEGVINATIVSYSGDYYM